MRRLMGGQCRHPLCQHAARSSPCTRQPAGSAAADGRQRKQDLELLLSTPPGMRAADFISGKAAAPDSAAETLRQDVAGMAALLEVCVLLLAMSQKPLCTLRSLPVADRQPLEHASRVKDLTITLFWR